MKIVLSENCGPYSQHERQKHHTSWPLEFGEVIVKGEMLTLCMKIVPYENRDSSQLERQSSIILFGP